MLMDLEKQCNLSEILVNLIVEESFLHVMQIPIKFIIYQQIPN